MSEIKYTISLVPTEMVRQAWSKVRPHLKSAIRRSNGRWTPDYVLASLALGEQQLWVVLDETGGVHGAVTSQVVSYPEKTVLTIHFLGGNDFASWYKSLLDTLSRYAKDTKCSAIECVARPGFWKWFGQDGFEKTSVFYEKVID